MNLKESTYGLSEQVLLLAQAPTATTVLSLQQEVFNKILELKKELLFTEQVIENRESAILIAIAANKELSNDVKRKAAKQALSAEDPELVQAVANKEALERRLSALEFTASQCRTLAQLLKAQQ